MRRKSKRALRRQVIIERARSYGSETEHLSEEELRLARISIWVSSVSIVIAVVTLILNYSLR